MTSIIRVALYARVSSQQQADSNTIDSQTHAILERIRCDGLRVDPECIFCDDGYSGSELLRPALESLRDRVAASLIDVITSIRLIDWHASMRIKRCCLKSSASIIAR